MGYVLERRENLEIYGKDTKSRVMVLLLNPGVKNDPAPRTDVENRRGSLPDRTLQPSISDGAIAVGNNPARPNQDSPS